MKDKYFTGDIFENGRVRYILAYRVTKISTNFFGKISKEIEITLPVYKFIKYKKSWFSKKWKKVSSDNISIFGLNNCYLESELDTMISDGWVYKPTNK